MSRSVPGSSAHQFIERHWFERLHQSMSGHGSVLDLGCGSGDLSLVISDPGLTNVTGVDARIRLSVNTAIVLHTGFG